METNVRTQSQSREVQRAVPAPAAARGLHLAPPLRLNLHRLRPMSPDIAWAVFVGINLAAMRLIPAWQTVPFLAIWVSLTAIYGFRLWRIQPTILTLAAVTLATGGIIFVQVLKGQQDADYLAEVPLIALMFLVMVWHGRRRLAATEERLTAMEQVHRISQENLRLLEQQRQFLQDASHELGTPITVALGHAELIERAATDQAVAADARVVTGELARLRPPPARPAPRTSCTWRRFRSIPWSWTRWNAGATSPAAGGWGRSTRRPCAVTATGSSPRWTRCWRTPSRTPSRATPSRSASISRAGTRSWP